MLSFRWVLGDMTDNSPGEILALLADLANADEEHVNEPFSPEPAVQSRGSARCCGKDGHEVGAASVEPAPPYVSPDLPASSRRSLASPGVFLVRKAQC